MTSRALLPAWLATAACGPDAASPLDASCAPTDHPLQVACTARFAEASRLEITLRADGEATRTVSRAPARDHALVVWGLPADTRWRWRIGDARGTVATGLLPERFERATLEAAGALPEGTDGVLLPLKCDGQVSFVVVDTRGRVIGYTDTDAYHNRMDGYAWSDADRSVLAARRRLLSERGMDGGERLRVEGDEVLVGVLHHDLARWGPYTYLIHRVEQDGFNVDGVQVLEGARSLGTWRVTDRFALPDPDGASFDFSHANGITVDDDGRIFLSLRNLDSVVVLDGDPDSVGFLDVLTVIGGQPGVDADVHPIDGPRQGFARQHNASWHDGRLWVFDNLGMADGARAARYVVDDDALRLDREWPLEVRCDVQGGAVPIPGGVLVTCPALDQMLAFTEDDDAPVWTLHATCDADLAQPTLNRGLPVVVR